jgi:hypothetical protein
MSIGSRIRGLLRFGGEAQFLLAVLGAFGINIATAGAVWAVIAPDTASDYLILVGIFLGLTPLTFPLSAVLLNLGLARVENSRRKNLFDDPIETARKRIDALTVEGQNLYEDLPTSAVATRNEWNYHTDRLSHWLMRVDAELSREAGRYAALWFITDPAEDVWKQTSPQTVEGLRAFQAEHVARLSSIRDELPIDRRKWLRYSTSLDIASGRTLLSFLNAPAPDGHDESFGIMSMHRWVTGVEKTFREDAPEYAHLFAADTYAQLETTDERADYVGARVDDLERIWKEL